MSLPDRVRRWKDAWEAGDAAAVAALYAPDGRHDSAKVARVLGPGTVLIGRAAIWAYAAAALQRVGWVRFDITAVVSDGRRDVVKYLRTARDDGTPQRVAEILEWEGAQLAAVRVYHY